MIDCVLGVDTGTSGTRALLVEASGRVVGGAVHDYPMATPRPGWAEQDPRTWLDAAKETIVAVMSRYGEGRRVAAIGLTGQMHGSVFLNGAGQVLRPAILWCDQRTTSQCEAVTERVGGRARLIELTCNPALEGFTAPKLVWVRDHEPGLYASVAKILLPKDYVRWGLTGAYASDVSDASGTLLFDVRHRRWSDPVLAALDIPRSWLPDVTESPVVSGRLSPDVARELGLEPGTPVVGGGGDQAAGAVGNGIVAQGLVSSTIGTSGVVFAHSDEITLDPLGRVHTFCHAVPGAWHVMGVTQGAGLSLRWFRDQFGAAEIATAGRLGTDPYELLTREAERSVPGSEGLIWLPYLMGERTPHLDANARGVLFGITARHTRADVVRAIMEGVTYSLRDCLTILREMGVPSRQVRASGGGARSALWRQMQADVFGTEVVTVHADEGPSFGAALLAAVGAGFYPSVPSACAATVSVGGAVAPDPSRAAVYDHRYATYRSLYPALAQQFAALAAASA